MPLLRVQGLRLRNEVRKPCGEGRHVLPAAFAAVVGELMAALQLEGADEG